jgi:hypothetical protein
MRVRAVTSVAAMSDVIRIGGRSTSMTEAKEWVSEYFSPANQNLKKPYAHPPTTTTTQAAVRPS